MTHISYIILLIHQTKKFYKIFENLKYSSIVKMAIRKKETKELKEEIKTPSKRKYTRKKKSEQQIIEDSSKNVKIPSSSGVILPKIDIEGIKVENNEKQESNNVQSATLSVSLNNVSNNEIKNNSESITIANIKVNSKFQNIIERLRQRKLKR